MDDGDLHGFVEQFRRLTELAHERLPPPIHAPSALVDRLTDHLGHPARELPVITEAYPGYEHANVQLAIDAWRAEHGEGSLHGISGQGREHHSFTELLVGGGYFSLGAVDYTSVPVGVDAEQSCGTDSARPPRAVISSTTAARCTSSRAATVTAAPAAAKALAVAAPMPRLAPVTIATRPAKGVGVGFMQRPPSRGLPRPGQAQRRCRRYRGRNTPRYTRRAGPGSSASTASANGAGTSSSSQVRKTGRLAGSVRRRCSCRNVRQSASVSVRSMRGSAELSSWLRWLSVTPRSSAAAVRNRPGSRAARASSTAASAGGISRCSCSIAARIARHSG